MSTKALTTTGLEEALREVLPESSLVLEDGSHLVDGVKPQFTATPSSSAELADVLACANEHDAAIIPWGAGSSMLLGNVPERYDIALSTTRLDRVLEYEPADLTVTVEAGLTLAKLQALLNEQGQFLPIGGPPQATVGGLLAVGHGGPSQHAYGRPRDWLLGCRIALVDGTVVHTGGRVVKNVAGYDLSRMMVGSLGTLGVFVEVTLKVAPLPAREETLLITHADMIEACDAIRAAAKRGLALRATCVIGNRAVYWLSGAASAVERTRRELDEAADGSKIERMDAEAGEQFWDALAVSDAAPELEVRASVPPSKATDALRQLEVFSQDLSLGIGTVAYPTIGILIARLSDGDTNACADFIEQTRRAAVDAGGSLVVTRASADLKARLDVWGESSALSLMRSLKEEFDPRSVLNPGRYVGSI